MAREHGEGADELDVEGPLPQRAPRRLAAERAQFGEVAGVARAPDPLSPRSAVAAAVISSSDRARTRSSRRPASSAIARNGAGSTLPGR
ncbi:hypothetical protein ACFQHO_34780 [Actinomadura yumaensis]|uniref:hypothetical protein n=1 Tax=Actinomadura TaxID=1988 RepID=UPI00132667B8|nr:hypothetical protein [Actinomadura sp. J1-007]MWK33154.1 hypothetical protein [Actinomadura sp. J1-007]